MSCVVLQRSMALALINRLIETNGATFWRLMKSQQKFATKIDPSTGKFAVRLSDCAEAFHERRNSSK